VCLNRLCLLQLWHAVRYASPKGQSTDLLSSTAAHFTYHTICASLSFACCSGGLLLDMCPEEGRPQKSRILLPPSAGHLTIHTICASPICACCSGGLLSGMRHQEGRAQKACSLLLPLCITTSVISISPTFACCSGGLLLDVCQEEGRAQKACSTGWEGACSAARHRAAACTGVCCPGAS
jgi:hypothetical protein